MQFVGAQNRRLSYHQVNPEMPKLSKSELEGIRTSHRQLGVPSERLKNYKRHNFFADIDLETEVVRMPKKTLGKSGKKYKQTIATMGSENQSKFDSKIPKSSSEYENKMQIDNQNLPQIQHQHQQDTQLQLQSNHHQDYVLGETFQENVQEESEEQKIPIKFKSYNIQNHDEESQCEAEIRMQNRYIRSNYAEVKAREQTKDFFKFLNKFQIAKHRQKVEAKRRNESKKLLTSIQRKISLPTITKKNQNVQQIIVPSYEQLYHENQSNEKQIIKHSSLSSLRQPRSRRNPIFKNPETYRNFQNQYFEEEYKSLSKLNDHLRKKGVKIEAQAIRKGLLNIREFETNIQEKDRFVQPLTLLSNPLIKK